jgi:phosphatidylglycerol:prolipoprotein diacylglycerol transferase
MLIYPKLNPVALHIGPLRIYWYGLMYLLSFVVGWKLLSYRIKKAKIPFSGETITDLVFYCAIGVILGGRIGYMLIYNFTTFIHQPWILFKLWEGGMSFHGGLIGVGLALALWCHKKRSIHWATLTDLIVPIVPIGLAAGRLGNFINGELWGKITTMPCGMVYPFLGPETRHPSELY